VIEHLALSGTVSKIAVWGRSMGAATAIMYMANNQDKVSAAVLDSGFSNFHDIINHIAMLQFQIPPQFVQFLMMGVSQQITALTGGLNVNDLTPVTFAPRCKVPAYFLHGKEDDFVLKHHTEQNFAAYGSDKKTVDYCSGGHNDSRPQDSIEKIVKFL
jgi:fermentation-respiration switch protein FrsA (DUF1100 family)